MGLFIYFIAVGVGSKVSMVSCGADKGVYFRTAEKVNWLSTCSSGLKENFNIVFSCE